MSRHVLAFHQIDDADFTRTGAKAAHLAGLARLDGIRVPPGFCVTTVAFRRALAEAPALDAHLDHLAHLDPGDHDAIRALSGEIRHVLQATSIPNDVADQITRALDALGKEAAVAVRSSATAEDLPGTSFAGQHDSFLNIRGTAAVLEHITRTWASLFTERAVTYRIRNGFDHRSVQMAVIVQQMIDARASGILFTADPVTGNRTVTSIEACYGLGESLVAGRVTPDTWKVRDDAIIKSHIATKRTATVADPIGGTLERQIEQHHQTQPALTDAQVIRLAAVGRRIEAHFGSPQDVEWALDGDDVCILQSRPITTLFPIPPAGDDTNRVYISVGHQQMMTDAMTPLGLSVWQLTTPRPMAEAGGRLFVDVTRQLASPTTRDVLLAGFGRTDPLITDALETILDRDDFIATTPDDDSVQPPPVVGAPSADTPIETDRAIVAELVARARASIATLQRAIATKSGTELLDFILADFRELRVILFDPPSHQAIMAGMNATWWLNEHLEDWLGEKNAADTLTLSAPNNITSEMGLALLDVADTIRAKPAVVEFFEQMDEDDDVLDRLGDISGGIEARDAIQAWLDRYGMRCVGEIDITRPRWSERPSALVPIILANIRNFEHGEAARRFERGLEQARQKAHDVLRRLRALPGGERKADETRRMIDRVRTFIGYREFPKYGMIARYFLYKQALRREAERLVQRGVIGKIEDIYFLRLQELRDVVRTQHADADLIRERKAAFVAYQSLTPPRVLTSDGEMLNGAYRRDGIPAHALPGLAVSAGTVEGRARIILDMASADLERGDILVTTATDPSWTPLFVTISGLVTEVGGLMTHGAVIAREYGLPAVVAVANATTRIRDGQRIRVHGTEGYVEALS